MQFVAPLFSAVRPPLRAARRHNLAFSIVAALLLCVPVVVLAQPAEILIGSKVLVVNTEGQGLNLRETPNPSSVVVTKAPEQSVLEVVAAERRVDGRRWIQVRDENGKVGWAVVDFLSVLSAPPRTILSRSGGDAQDDPPPATDPTTTATPVPPAEATATPVPTATPKPGAPLEVEPKIKAPETSDRRQTIQVTITRDGAPAPDVTVYAVTQNVDPPIVRDLGRTDDEGIINKSFEIKRDQGEKGTVVQVVIAVHPDGGSGWNAVSWFKR